MRNILLCILLMTTPAHADQYDKYRVECTADQISAIQAATATAKTMLQKAAAAIPPNNSTTGQAFQRWFGGAVGDTDPIIKSLYEDLQTRMSFSAFWCPPPASFGGGGRHPNIFAWVPSDAQTEIFLEQLFFESTTTGVDSQAGTIIHELSHNSTVANFVDSDHDGDGTDDYGMANAVKLATKNPGVARRTSDNLQYFAEDLMWGI
ncbi:MAG: M35 family metallo-endopeptidase [Rhizobiaceae bacterium]